MTTTGSRIDRQWSGVLHGVETHEKRTRIVKRGGAVMATFAVAAALFFFFGRHHTAPAVVVLKAGTEASTWTHTDGSHVTIAPGGQLEVDAKGSDAAAVSVRLIAGTAAFDVRHDPKRRFAVHVRDVDIEDIGTKFTVAIAGESVQVQVQEGTVRVRRADTPPMDIHGGERWPEEPHAAALDDVKEAAPAEVVEPTTTASAPVVPPSDPLAAFRTLESSDPNAAYASVGPRYRALAQSAGPKDLFDMARVARATQHAPDAALAYDGLRRRFRGDPRAGIAAMELGRLRQDTLADPAGAEEALRDAIALGPDAPYREDAEARLIRVLDAQQKKDACSVARDAYLARYPTGIHVESVRHMCSR
jgi:transmembrane sensor